MKKEVIVLGGGAAGLMCAIEAGKRGRSVLVLERSERIGKKVLISGGGRCNFTNLYAGPENYLSENPDFCKSALARYTPQDFIALVEKHTIGYHEKKLGQLFCNGSSKEIVEMLKKECSEAGVEIRLHTEVQAIRRLGGFEVETARETFQSEALVVATGGLSVPKIGATDFGYRVAEQFGVQLTKRRPGLVPLTFSGEERKFCAELSGISLPVVMRQGRTEFAESLLLTHRGLSGPVILQVSSYWHAGEEVEVDLLPGVEGEEWLRVQRGQVSDAAILLSRCWPHRFAQAWCQRYLPSHPPSQWSADQLREAGRLLNHWRLKPAGSEGYLVAEVTMGGVDTRELSSKTMECRRVPGLYFIGEVVDVTGWLGGYNFQWAWASGHAAGQEV